jgi:hypothetical protein
MRIYFFPWPMKWFQNGFFELFNQYWCLWMISFEFELIETNFKIRFDDSLKIKELFIVKRFMWSSEGLFSCAKNQTIKISHSVLHKILRLDYPKLEYKEFTTNVPINIGYSNTCVHKLCDKTLFQIGCCNCLISPRKETFNASWRSWRGLMIKHHFPTLFCNVFS